MNGISVALSSAVLFASPLAAQNTTPAPLVANAPTQAVLRAGTEVAVTMSEELTTKGKNLKSGQRFMMQTAEAVTVNGQVVIPVGSPVTGEVTDVRNKGMWGKSGRINARVLFVRANGRQIRMTGQLDDKGVTGTGGVVAAVALLPVAGFFTTGTSARIPVGAPVKAFIDEDVAVEFGNAAPAPMMVAPAAAMPVTPAPAK